MSMSRRDASRRAGASASLAMEPAMLASKAALEASVASPSNAAPAPESEARRDVLPQKLHGVPDILRSWWQRVDAQELERATLRAGRTEILGHVARRIRDCKRVLDLGCGPGLLAKEAGRPEIVGVDMSPQMLDAARDQMDVVVPENILEYYPSECFDAAVLCNVLEPYPADMCRVMFKHAFEFLDPGGILVIVLTTATVRNSPAAAPVPDAVEEDSPARPDSTSGGGGTGVAATCEIGGGLDLLFPGAHASGLSAEGVEDELSLAGFDVEPPELFTTKTVNSGSVVPGEEPRVERRSYALLVGRRPRKRQFVLARPKTPNGS